MHLSNSHISYLYMLSQVYLCVDLTYNGWSDLCEDGEKLDSARISWTSTEAVWNYDWNTIEEL
jgi:hypothetical protein